MHPSPSDTFQCGKVVEGDLRNPHAQEPDEPTGLLSLPAHLLHLIARDQGPHIRATCTTLCDAYGPLDVSIDLTPHSHITSQFGTQHLLTNLFHTNPHVTTLALPEPLLYRTLLAEAAARFPHLQTLTWPTYTPPTNPTLSQLSPLHATLTALHIHPLPHPLFSPPPPPHLSPPPLTSLSALTSLCSLTLPCTLPPTPLTPTSTTHPTPLHSWLAPLAHLPHLHTLALIPTHPRSAVDDPLPALAAATPHLTSLSIPAWALCGPSSAATLSPSTPSTPTTALTATPSTSTTPTTPSPTPTPTPTPAPTWPHLRHLHLNFQHPPPADPEALPNCTASIAALSTHPHLASVISATVHLPCLAGIDLEAGTLGWLEALPLLPLCDLTITFDEHRLAENCEAGACLWEWLQGQQSLTKLTIGDPSGQTPSRRQATVVPSPYAAITSLATCLQDLQLGLHWAQGFSQFVSEGLGQLTHLTRLSVNDAPTPTWEEGVDDFDHYALDPLTELRELQMGNLRATAFNCATALPQLQALTILDTRDPETVGASRCWELCCLTKLAGSLTRLALQGLPRFQCTGLAVLGTLTKLSELRLTEVSCLTVEVGAGGRELYGSRLLGCLLPLPGSLRQLVVDGGPLRLTKGQVQELMEAVGDGCRVRVDYLEMDGREMTLDTKYGMGPVMLGPQWQVGRRRPATRLVRRAWSA